MQLRERGEGPADIDSGSVHQQREARQHLMAERFRDHERAEQAEERGDNVQSDEAPPTHEDYDLDNREQRHAYLADRLRGVTDPSATYDRSNYVEPWEDE